jgi:hypothetical protein
VVYPSISAVKTLFVKVRMVAYRRIRRLIDILLSHGPILGV